MPVESTSQVRVAAIQFLNPAPLLYGFEHARVGSRLRERYALRYTTPALCAEQLQTGDADLGLVPIGALPYLPELLAAPGCVIASLRKVRSIQLVVKPGLELKDVRSIAADQASRSSLAYARILLRAFYDNDPVFNPAPATLGTMLADHDAALLIGDPALLALEDRDQRGLFLEHRWFDIAELWHGHTGLPWVAAVWAVRPEVFAATGLSPHELVQDLVASRDAGLANIDTIVREWAGRIAVPPETVLHYLTANIHYRLDEPCLAAVQRFYDLAAQTGVLPAYTLPLLR